MEKMSPDAMALDRSASGTLPTGAASSGAIRARDRRAILTRAVQLHVIPQLLHQSPGRAAASLHRHVEQLAALSLQSSSHEVIDFTTGLLESGYEPEAIFLELLTPTAQLLGQYWADDHCTFADVTIGVGHLKSAMRALRAAFFDGARPAGPGAPRALLLPLPGEQHDFGVSMLSVFFARAGWDVWAGVVTHAPELAHMVRRDWIDLVGFSVSHDAMLDTVRAEIAAVRHASHNRGLVVMVGGLPFTQNPALAAVVGADGMALDGAQAVEVATALLPPRPSAP